MSDTMDKLVRVSNDLTAMEREAKRKGKKPQSVNPRKQKKGPSGKAPKQRNPAAQGLAERGGAGAGVHKDQNKRKNWKSDRKRVKRDLKQMAAALKGLQED